MADIINVETDSEDEMLLEYFVNTRRLKRVRPRRDNFGDWDCDEFFVRFRITKETALFVLQQVEDELEYVTDRNCSLSPMNQLLLTLRFYATAGSLTAVGDFSGVHKTTAGRIITKVSHALASLRRKFIYMPRNREEKLTIQRKFFEVAAFPRVIGAIDCTHVRIVSPGGDNAEVFRNRKGYFNFNVQTVASPDLCIQNVVARWPGSSHDATIYRNSVIKARVERGDFFNGVLLGDAGYPMGATLLTPLRNPRLPEENLYNESHIRTRNTVERLYGVWKARFPILALGIRQDISLVQPIIVACAVIHNIAIQRKEADPPPVPGMDQEELQLAVQEGQITPAINLEVPQREAVRETFVRFFRDRIHRN